MNQLKDSNGSDLYINTTLVPKPPPSLHLYFLWPQGGNRLQGAIGLGEEVSKYSDYSAYFRLNAGACF